ncbi:hypothetical protein Tco_0332020 [Tanacetum coccineum]
MPVLQKDDYDTWAMEMEHYLEYIDNEVGMIRIESKKRVTKGKMVIQGSFLQPHSKNSLLKKRKKARTHCKSAVQKIISEDPKAKASSSKNKPSQSSGSIVSYALSSSLPKATPTATPGLADEVIPFPQYRCILQGSASLKGQRRYRQEAREQEDIDDSLYEYGKFGPQPQSPSPTVSETSSTVYSTCPSNDSDGEQGTDHPLKAYEHRGYKQEFILMPKDILIKGAEAVNTACYTFNRKRADALALKHLGSTSNSTYQYLMEKELLIDDEGIISLQQSTKRGRCSYKSHSKDSTMSHPTKSNPGDPQYTCSYENSLKKHHRGSISRKSHNPVKMEAGLNLCRKTVGSQAQQYGFWLILPNGPKVIDKKVYVSKPPSLVEPDHQTKDYKVVNCEPMK